MALDENALKAKREYYALMLKQKDRNLLDVKTIKDLKKVGILFSEAKKDRKPSNGKKKNEWTGQMQICPAILRKIKGGHVVNDEEDWKPKSIIKHENDFFEWINSMTFGLFPDKIRYDKFEFYKAQAQHWCDTYQNPYDAKNEDEKKSIILSEYNKIERNTLYFSMKHNWIPEGSIREGRFRYVPKEHSAIILYMLDCDYLFLLGKGRQIFATTTMGIYINKKLITQENFYMKFITEDEKTGKEILNDKIKAPFKYYDNYLKPGVDRDYQNGFKLGKAKVKGDEVVPNSRVEIVAPTPTAINAGSPQVVFIDEAASTPDLVKIVLEQRPTLFLDPNQDGNLILKRKIILWSTGTTSPKGKMAYYSMFSSIVALWEEKKFESALFVPLFFSWHCRCDDDFYGKIKLSYYNNEVKELEGFSEEERKQIFHMHFPTTWTDMFAVATNKLVSSDIISGNMSRIRNLKAEDKPIYGRFEPVYDRTKPLPDEYGIPFKIIDANFIPYDDTSDNTNQITCEMFMRAENWENRYFQGTDPIQTDVGQSMFASAVWDKHLKTFACIINYRPQGDSNDAFLQSVLMGIYYDEKPRGAKKGIPELIENNVGMLYKKQRELFGYNDKMIYNKELPIDLQGGGQNWGFSMYQKRKEVAVGELKNLILNYADNFHHNVIFKQLDTYVPIKKSNCYSYEPIDKRLYKDDALDACTTSNIAGEVCTKEPKDLSSKETEKRKLVAELVRSKNGDLYSETKLV